MRSLFLLPVLALLAACGGGNNKVETYTCPNGPDLRIVYTDEGATVLFPSERVEVLPPTETVDLYAKPGIVLDARQFRTARLTDGERSYSCDQMAG